jgi:hypothetical protein
MSNQSEKPWRYAVRCRSAAGEERTIVVTLTDDERRDALSQRSPVGGPKGLIVQGYAQRRACEVAMADFGPAIADVAFVTLH